MPTTTNFRGIARATLDSKGRMALPSRHREAMVATCKGQVTVTLSLRHPCLWLYPRPAWNNVQKEIEALPNIHNETREVQQLLIGNATDLELDGNGRLLLPAQLREQAGLDKKLALVGQGNKIEIWEDHKWLAHMQDVRRKLLSPENGQLSEDLAALSI